MLYAFMWVMDFASFVPLSQPNFACDRTTRIVML